MGKEQEREKEKHENKEEEKEEGEGGEKEWKQMNKKCEKDAQWFPSSLPWL
jgi:hypothetical protein